MVLNLGYYKIKYQFQITNCDLFFVIPLTRRKQHTPSDLSTGTSVWGSSKGKESDNYLTSLLLE